MDGGGGYRSSARAEGVRVASRRSSFPPTAHTPADALALCFAETGVPHLPGCDPWEGRAAIAEHPDRVVRDLAHRSTRPPLRHHVWTVWIELTGSASAATGTNVEASGPPASRERA